MTTKLTDTEAGAEILKKVVDEEEEPSGLARRASSLVDGRMRDGTLALAGGALLLVAGVRALSKNRTRGVVQLLAGATLVGLGLRRSRRGASTTESEDERTTDVEGTEGATSATVRHDTEESEIDVAEEVAEQPGASDDEAEAGDADEDEAADGADGDTDQDDGDTDADDGDTDTDSDENEAEDEGSPLSSDDDYKYET